MLTFHINPLTNNGILWGLLHDGTVLTKLENGEIVENNIQEIKLHLNPIEKMIEVVDEHDYQLIPMKQLAEIAGNTVAQEYEIKGLFAAPDNFVCAIQFRDLTHKYDFYILSFSEKNGFILESKDREGKKQIQPLQNHYRLYQQLFSFHINLFDRRCELDKSRYIIKENDNTGIPPGMYD